MSIQSLLSNKNILSSIAPTPKDIVLTISPNYSTEVFGSIAPSILYNGSTITGDLVNLTFQVFVRQFNFSDKPALLFLLPDNISTLNINGMCLIELLPSKNTSFGIGQVRSGIEIAFQNVNNINLGTSPATLYFNISFTNNY